MIRIRNTCAALCVLLLATPATAQDPASRAGIYGDAALDFFVPGYGAFARQEYVAGSLFAAGRLGTLYAAGAYYVQFREYQSAERAARNADLFFGPGLRYKDPYAGGYGTADDFRDKAERRAFFAGTAVTLHIALTIVSLWWTVDHGYAEYKRRCRYSKNADRRRSAAGGSMCGTMCQSMRW